MIITFGRYWLLILVALLTIGYTWYWSARVSHRAIERMGQQEPERFGFSWRTRQRKRDKKL
ncbi:MAG TPA: hypothetical protein DDZ53_08745 [Firmicutes bacterium]|nr:hypothetical protein [Bacillota bacterium]